MNRKQLITYLKSVIYANTENLIDATKHQQLEENIINSVLTKEDDLVNDPQKGGLDKAPTAEQMKKINDTVINIDERLIIIEEKDEHDKGYYTTEAKLFALVPNPNSGDFANVAGIKYVCEESDIWINTGDVAPISPLELNEYAKTDTENGEVIRTGELAQEPGQSTTLAVSQKLFTDKISAINYFTPEYVLQNATDLTPTLTWTNNEAWKTDGTSMSSANWRRSNPIALTADAKAGKWYMTNYVKLAEFAFVLYLNAAGLVVGYDNTLFSKNRTRLIPPVGATQVAFTTLVTSYTTDSAGNTLLPFKLEQGEVWSVNEMLQLSSYKDIIGIHVSATLSAAASFGTIPVDFKTGDKVNIYLPPNVSNNRTYCTYRNASNATVLAVELIDGDNINVLPADVASLYFYYGGTGYIESYVYLLSGLNDLVINNNESKLKNKTLLNSQSALNYVDENMKYNEATQLSFKTDTVTTDTTKLHNGSIIKGKQFEFKTLAGSNPVIYGIDIKNGVNRTQGTIITVLIMVYSPKLMKRIIPMILSGTGIKIVDTNCTHLNQGWNTVYFKIEYVADSDGGLEYIQYRTGLEANETSFLNTTMFFSTPVIFDYDAAYLDYNFVKLYEKLGKPILSTSEILASVTLVGDGTSTYDANTKTITKLHSSTPQIAYLRHNPSITLPSGDYVLMCKYEISGVEKNTIAKAGAFLSGSTDGFTPFDGTYAYARKYTGVINSSTFFGIGAVISIEHEV